MKKNKTFKVVLILVVLAMALSMFSACKETTQDPDVTANQTDTPAATDAPAVERSTTPLVVGYMQFSEKFSPFFADTGYDSDVSATVVPMILTTDRTGAIVYNAIEGETHSYNGVDYLYQGPADFAVDYDETADKTVYTITLRDDLVDGEGVAMTADDLIFTFYVLSDPSYDGSSTLYTVPIVGMNDYRTQTSEDVYAKYAEMFEPINTAGRDHVWTEADTWTQENQDSFWALNEEVWKADVQAIVNYVYENYLSYYEDYAGITSDDMADGAENIDGKKIAAGMALWGYGEYADGVLTSSYLGKTWTYANGEYPTIDDYYQETLTAYEGDIVAYAGVESPGDNAADKLKDRFIMTEGPKDPSLGEDGIPNITGIVKVDDYTVQVTLNGFDAAAIYKFGVNMAPLHYYGDVTKYDYENNMFGFDYGDLSTVKAKTTQPMGWGPYKFIKYENRVVYFEGNENYYQGEPITYYMQFKETADADKIPGIATGTIDITDPSFGNAEVEQIKGYNSNGEIVGDVITTNTVNNLGYGYIGINANTVNVGGVPDSDASKNLRRGFATLLAAYRSLTVDSYYGERASVINYPISNTSWVAPQPADDGYKIAFAVDVNGNDLYTSEMVADDRYAVALQAAVDFFVAAGYTYDETTGMLTAAPEGAKLEYEMVVPGDGAGDHPSFLLVTKFAESLETIGMSIIINDPTSSNVLWDKLDAETNEMWCAAWGATLDPDMYQVYHSDNSTHSNHYHIADADLDQLIMDARTSPDQAFRKATYKACLDIIIDWAVEVPIYQRQNCIIFSTERVNMDTVTPDITTFWGWMEDIELLEMNPVD